MVGKRKVYKDKAKNVVGKTATKTVKATKTVVKIIFILIIAYTIIISIYLFLTTDPEKFLTNIAMISVGGFWAFFLGYFGWRMGETVESHFKSMKKKK